MKKRNGKKRKYVFIQGIRYIQQSGLLVLDQVINNTMDQFHNYACKQNC